MSNSTHFRAPAPLFHFAKQVSEGFTVSRTDGNGIKTATIGIYFFVGNQVDLVENQQSGDFMQFKLTQDTVYRADLLLETRVGEVDHVQ